MLEENPAVREKYARRYEQCWWTSSRTPTWPSTGCCTTWLPSTAIIFVVGDADQSIYRWRGADYRNVLRFEQDFPDAQVILLEQNYRSTQAILDVAMAVIDRNPHRTRKRLFTERGDGQKVDPARGL